MPSPLQVLDPRPGRRRSAAWWPGRRSGRPPAGPAPARSSAQAERQVARSRCPRPAIPTGVALTMRSAASAELTVASPPTFAGQGGGGQDLVAAPAHDLDPAAPASASASTTARAAPRTRGPGTASPRATSPRSASESHEAGPVGAVADQLATQVGNGVDHAQALGHRAQALARLGCPRLVGHRHRQAPDPEVDHGRHRRPRPPGGDREGDVGPVQAQLGEGGVVERGRKRVVDRVAYDPGDHRRGRRPRAAPGTGPAPRRPSGLSTGAPPCTPAAAG